MFLGIVVFLFLLAIFDLVVGVSNDAVNFMNSAIGAKAASFKTIIAIAAFGIFIGATLSNGMMAVSYTHLTILLLCPYHVKQPPTKITVTGSCRAAGARPEYQAQPPLRPQL